MRLENLPSPGPLSNGVALSKEVLKAINYAQVQADLSQGSAETGATLAQFFLECSKLCAPLTKKEKKNAVA
jgi:hypothetical protein